MKGSVSVELLKAVRKGVKSLPRETFDVMKSYVLSRMEENSSFMGKVPGGDIYYTAFGWLLSSCFSIMPDNRRMTAYLGSIDPYSLDLVHYASFVKCSMISKVGDGGMISLLKAAISRTPAREKESFSSFPGGDPDCPYTQFMMINISQDCFGATLNSSEVLSALEGYRTDEGTFSGVKGGSTPSVQATCCALVVKGYLEGFRREDAQGLRMMQDPTGGFKANPGAPVPDLLSTAVALFTLSLYGEEPLYDPYPFIEAHLDDSGTFIPTVLDGEGDIEYLFYGLLALGSI